MIELFKKYMLDPLSSFYKVIQYSLEVQGMARAARELHRLGYYKEYEKTVQRMREMKP
jgi:hypothetical protein